MVMRQLSIILALVLTTAMAQVVPAFRIRTYFVSGVKDKDDVATITAAIQKLPSVTEVVGLTPKTGAVTVRFDAHTISHGQVAYAIMSVHARPGHNYGVAMRFSIPEYSRGKNSRAVEAIMKREAKLVEIILVNRREGLFEAKVLPFVLDPAKNGPQGFHFGPLFHAIHDVPPNGLGLDFAFIGRDGKPDPLE